MLYPDHKDKLKDGMGRYRTQSLFEELYQQGYNPIWSLREEGASSKELPSLKQLYLDSNDPTEYSFAIAAFGSWKHWLKIKNAKALQPWIEDWSAELEVKLRSEGIAGVIQEAQSGKSPYNAAKSLAEGFWNKKQGTHGRGRPSKDEVKRELKIAAKLDEEFTADAERIGLQVINGSK